MCDNDCSLTVRAGQHAQLVILDKVVETYNTGFILDARIIFGISQHRNLLKHTLGQSIST